ncbi:MAG: NUDIX hydrolase [Muribaculaceae bacterium]|nr:NUDIX hydrolase [Muribaculaceae bacterium]
MGDYCYKYPHAALTADCVIFGFDGYNLKILLIERGLEPYKGMWALPGGFMKVADPEGGKIDLTIEDTAKRELKEETNLSGVFLQQFRVYSRFDRDPRERVVTVAFIALVGPQNYRKVFEETVAGDDASNAMWWNVDFLPPMAFDHTDIISDAKEYLAEMIRIKPLAFNLLDSTFSMTELQNVYEAITGQSYDRRNFQRKAIQSGLLDEVKLQNEASSFDMDSGFAKFGERKGACACREEDNIAMSAPPADKRQISPRKRKKFFTLRSERKKSDDSENEESGIKDLFNF